MVTAPDRPHPVITVYQDDEHVEGLLQQLANLGLLTSHELEDRTSASEEARRGGGGDVSAKVAAKLPGLLDAEAGLGGNRQRLRVDGTEESHTQRRQYTYTQAYHLHILQQYLRQHGLLDSARTMESWSAIKPGQFIEFQSSFLGNEISAILEIFSPDMISAIVRYLGRRAAVRFLDAEEMSFESKREKVDQQYRRADMHAELAHSVAEAIQADFRSDKTLEFYSTIKIGDESLTAVVICEKQYFLTHDSDRLLDGSFKVLGKIVSDVMDDVPALERNKLLRRLNPDLIDWLAMSFKSLPTQSVLNSISQDGHAFEGELVDSGFTGRLKGRSFKVVPIAIYV